MASTGQNLGSVVEPWPMVSPFTPFFWSEKVRATKLAALTSFKEHVEAGRLDRRRVLKRTSSNRKGVLRCSS